VARRAGVSQAAPYHYFRNKSALVAAVAESGFQLLAAVQDAALRQVTEDQVHRLAAFSASYVRFALDRPHYFKVMFRPHLAQHGEYPALGEAANQSFEQLVEVVRAARLASGQDDADPSVAATLIWAVPHGLALLYVDGPLATKTTPRFLEDLARAAMPRLAAASLDEIEPEPQWGV
jgi:AcrR family transcriptional regulator